MFDQVHELCGEIIDLVVGRFPHLQAFSELRSNVGCCNYYTHNGRMGWHADDKNFGTGDRPIVMASLGQAADFGYKLKTRGREEARTVRLESGDVVVFGGEARHMPHAVLKVHMGGMPSGLRLPQQLNDGTGRISITWREVSMADGYPGGSDERLGLRQTASTLPRYRNPTSKVDRTSIQLNSTQQSGCAKGRGSGAQLADE